MSISIKNLVDKFNTAVANTPSDLNLMELSIAANAISNVFSVSTSTQLPAAANNTGRLIYVDDLKAYRYSDGSNWSGDFSTTAITGQLFTFGDGVNGMLGDGTTVRKSSPVTVVGGFNDWSQVAAGVKQITALRTNGTLWSWGENAQGGLGDGTTVNKSSPVSVVGGFTDWCQVEVGFSNTVAVRRNGTLWAWGYGLTGRLGDGFSLNRSSPVSVLGGFTDWCQASAGRSHTAGVRTNGTLWAWGCGANGFLGDGTTVNKSSPVSVVGGFTDWCHVALGTYHAVALRTNGTLWAWGCGEAGRLGDGTTTDKSSPVSVVGGFTDWCQVSASRFTSAALRTNGTIWTWGANNNGYLGDGTQIDKSSPVSVIGGFTDWCQVSAGGNQTAGIRTNGTLWTWGSNCCGQLGDGTIVSKFSPVSVIAGQGSWCQVSAGSYSPNGSTTTAIRTLFTG